MLINTVFDPDIMKQWNDLLDYNIIVNTPNMITFSKLLYTYMGT